VFCRVNLSPWLAFTLCRRCNWNCCRWSFHMWSYVVCHHHSGHLQLHVCTDTVAHIKLREVWNIIDVSPVSLSSRVTLLSFGVRKFCNGLKIKNFGKGLCTGEFVAVKTLNKLHFLTFIFNSDQCVINFSDVSHSYLDLKPCFWLIFDWLSPEAIQQFD